MACSPYGARRSSGGNEARGLSSTQPDSMETQLSRFPNSFPIQYHGLLRRTQVDNLKRGLESALEVGYKTSLETARARNLLAFALYTLGRPDDALKELDRVLSMEDQTNNLVTLANKAVILWRENELSEAQDLVKCLEQIEKDDDDFEYLVVKAKAEVAFSFTRLGLRFSPDAVALFEQVLPNAREPELWLWKFGLGLTRRRALRSRPPALISAPSHDFENENRNILQIFLDIVSNCPCPSLKAKTYAEMATLLFSVSKTPLRKSFFDMAGMSTTEACKNALQLDDSDKSVLCKCGIILRRCQQPERARELLEKCVSLRASTKAHHHLGLTYKFLATKEKYRDVVTPPPSTFQQLSTEQSDRKAGQNVEHVTQLATEQSERKAGQNVEHVTQLSEEQSERRAGQNVEHVTQLSTEQSERRAGQNVEHVTQLSTEQSERRAGQNVEHVTQLATEQSERRAGQNVEHVTQLATEQSERRAGQNVEHVTQLSEEPSERRAGQNVEHVTQLATEQSERRAGQNVEHVTQLATEQSERRAGQNVEHVTQLATEQSERRAGQNVEHVTQLSEEQSERRAGQNVEHVTQLSEEQSERRAGQNVEHVTQPSQQCLPCRSDHHRHDTDVLSPTYLPFDSPLSHDREVREIKIMIKSPSRNVTKFSRNDKYVKEALHHFQKAVEMKQENDRAVYDLALFQISLGELKSADQSLKDLLKYPQDMLPIEYVKVYEQLGQIHMELAETETDETKKRHLLKDSKSMLLTALKEASQIFQSSGVSEHLGEVFTSFDILFKWAEKSHDIPKGLEEKAILFKIIREHRHHLALLQELKRLDPQKEKDPEHLKLMIEDYVHVEDFDEATGVIEMLKNISQDAEVRQLFDDDHYVLKIYLKAARQALLAGRPADTHFRSALHQFIFHNPKEVSSSEFEDSDSAAENSTHPWDVVLVHEDSARAQAVTLTRVLQTICGLRVPDVDTLVSADRPELEEVDTVKNSTLTVVMAGGKVSDKTRFLIRNVAKRPTTISLLVEGDKVPMLLQAHRSFRCDASIFPSLQSALGGSREEPEVDAICKIVDFLFTWEKGAYEM
ncbi:uncharacterized protein LOC143291601 [Babylonia areolata]|uniref:uncharacterized protein LOC143291601 n=1 Tax=Babylonia areolata TaxID=304850 RepID=UPI003FD67246